METIDRINDLRNVAKTFFKKSLACAKITDVKAFFDLAQQANESADVLENDIKLESCWTYLHFVEYFGYSRKYADYMEFCIRNRFAPVSETDLTMALSYRSSDSAMVDSSDIVVQ